MAITVPADDDVACFVDSYVARRVEATCWSAIAGDVRRVVLAAAMSTSTARTMCSHVAAYAAWLHGEGLPTTAVSMADPEVLERYIQVGMPDSAEGSRATRRTVLRRVAQRIDPYAVPLPTPIPYRFVRPPYEPWQVSRFFDLARAQPTELRRRSALTVLSLGLGAGLDSRDLAWVNPEHVSRRTSGAVTVTVPGGPRPRRVVALDRYADVIAACTVGAAPGRSLLAGLRPGGSATASDVLAQLTVDPSLPRLLPSRLRSTWLLTLLNLGTPMPVILAAAGLSTARPLEDLLPLVEPLPQDSVERLLRGAA